MLVATVARVARVALVSARLRRALPAVTVVTVVRVVSARQVRAVATAVRVVGPALAVLAQTQRTVGPCRLLVRPAARAVTVVLVAPVVREPTQHLRREQTAAVAPVDLAALVAQLVSVETAMRVLLESLVVPAAPVVGVATVVLVVRVVCAQPVARLEVFWAPTVSTDMAVSAPRAVVVVMALQAAVVPTVRSRARQARTVETVALVVLVVLVVTVARLVLVARLVPELLGPTAVVAQAATPVTPVTVVRAQTAVVQHPMVALAARVATRAWLVLVELQVRVVSRAQAQLV